MSAPSNVGSDLANEVKTKAGWGIFLGVLTAILGVLLIAYPLIAATVTTIYIGWTLIMTGIFDVVQALRSHTAGAFFSRLLLGVVYGLGGAVLLLTPLRGVALLTGVLGVMLIIEAAATTIQAFQVKPASGRGWFLFDAAADAILGCLILANWPASSIWAVGTLVGVAVLMRGITRINLSTRLRRLSLEPEEIQARPPRAA